MIPPPTKEGLLHELMTRRVSNTTGMMHSSPLSGTKFNAMSLVDCRESKGNSEKKKKEKKRRVLVHEGAARAGREAWPGRRTIACRYLVYTINTSTSSCHLEVRNQVLTYKNMYRYGHAITRSQSKRNDFSLQTTKNIPWVRYSSTLVPYVRLRQQTTYQL